MELEPPYTTYFAVPQESTAGSFHLRFHSQTQKLEPPCTCSVFYGNNGKYCSVAKLSLIVTLKDFIHRLKS